MTVRIVTDSTADLPSEVAKDLGITVVPLYVRFGNEIFRDGIDLAVEDFYKRLTKSPAIPTTTAPSPADFYGAYSKLALEDSEILSIHISTKLSGTCSSAIMGRERMQEGCKVEVMDSMTTSMGLGLIVVAAAKAAKAGASLKDLSAMVKQAISRSHLFGLLDTLEYLSRGGRIGKAQAFLGMLLNVKAILDVKDGEVYPMARARSRSRGLDMLDDMIRRFPRIEEMALIYSTDGKDLDILAEKVSSIFPREKTYRARFGPVMGTHVGPRCIGVALLAGE